MAKTTARTNAPRGQAPQLPADQAEVGKPAWKSPVAVVVFLAVTGLTLAADLWSKHAVFSSLLSDPNVPAVARQIEREHGSVENPRKVLKALDLHHNVGWGLRLSLSTNPGVVFGLPMPPALVAVVTVLTISMVSWFFAVSAARSHWTHVALGLILSGALGNFYDRMLAAVHIPGIAEPIIGQVRDFLDFSQIRILGFNYPYVFNGADVWLVVGVAMLMLYWIFLAKAQKPQQKKHG